MMKKAASAILLLITTLVPFSAAAQETPVLDVLATGSLTASVYTRPWADKPLALTGLRGDLNLDGYAFDSLWFYISLYGYTNFAGLSDETAWNTEFGGPTLSFTASGNDRLEFLGEIKEFWIDFPLGDMDVRIGKQIMSWGLADGNNPTDILNARHVGTRFISTLDEQKIGSPAVNLVYNLPDNLGTVQGVFLPFSISADLPSIAMDLTIPGATTTNIHIPDDNGPVIAWENMEGGIRALFYTGPLSFSASYFTGIDRYPDFAVTSVFQPPSTVTITMIPEHNRIHQFGVDAALVTGGWDIRTEWALNLTTDMSGNDPAVKNPGLSGVLQVSRSFFDSALTVTAAWAPRIVFNHKAPDDYSDSDDIYTAAEIRKYDGQAYPFENALTVRVAGKFLNETIQPEAMFLAETAARDWLGTASLTWGFADGWSFKGGANFYGSFLPENDPDRDLGTFSSSTAIDNDSLYLELKYSF